MKKVFLILFIIFDMAVIGGAVFVLNSYVSHRTLPRVSSPLASLPGQKLPFPTTPAVSLSTINAAAGTPAILPPPGSGTQSKIFSYRNSRAKHVAIRADFTGWKAEPMLRDASGVWTYKVTLTPGEYAYCYSVDDKPPLKDPVNKRTKVIGRATVSAIVVEAAPSKAVK